MKKLLLLLAATAMVLAFSMPATAAESVGHQLCCENCAKCDLDDIICPATSINEDDSCYYFDYDSPLFSTYAVKTGAFGYTGDNEKCKVIFDICCCDEAAILNFKKDQTIGVRMTSLTDGFYFTKDTVHIDIYEDDDDALCDNDDMADPQAFPKPYTYMNAAGDVIDPATKGGDSCTVLTGEKAVVLESEKNTGYVITEQDITLSRCMWWFDMPAMRYDINDATPGARVNVKIELLSTGAVGICGEWDSICECIVDLGVWCTETEDCCMLFPYVITQSAPWATGITLVNLDPVSVPYGSMTATLYLTDKLGVTYTAEKTFSSDEYIWTFSLDSILGEFDGTPEPGSAYLRVVTNFTGHGYMFLTNGNYAGGTHAENCDGPCSD